MIRAVQSNFLSYFEAARSEFELKGRGCLICEWTDEEREHGVSTFYLTQGQFRATLKSEKPLFAWFKKTARPVIQQYDPETECVVVTTGDHGGPQISVLGIRSGPEP